MMAEQARRLHELGGLDRVDIRVLPWDVGAHVAMVNAFGRITFSSARWC